MKNFVEQYYSACFNCFNWLYDLQGEGNLQVICRKFAGNLQEICRKFAGNLQGEGNQLHGKFGKVILKQQRHL